MLIRQLVENDLGPCISLFIEVFNQPPWNDRWTHEAATRVFNDLWNTPGFKGYVAIDETQGNSMAAAMLGREKQWWNGKEYLIEEFFVKCDLQGQKLGSRLLEYACSDSKLYGIDTVILLTDTLVPAYSFYLGKDFKENKTLRLLYKHL